MITKRVVAIALAGAMCLAVPAAYAGVAVKGVDTSSFPVLRVSVLTSDPSTQPPGLRENGQHVRIERAENLGAEKSVVLAIDRSQSMRGAPLANAIAAARSFLASKPAADRLAVASFATKPQILTDFSTERSDLDGALRSIKVDPVQGTTLYDAIVRASNTLASEHARGPGDHRRDRRERNAQLGLSERGDRGCTQSQDGDLRRRHREREVQSLSSPQARRAHGWRVPRDLVQRDPDRRVREDRGRAPPHVAARLRDRGAARGNRLPRVDLERPEVGSAAARAAREPRPGLRRQEALAPAARRLLRDCLRNAGDGPRLLLHRPPRRIPRADHGEGCASQEAPRATHREGSLRRRSGSGRRKGSRPQPGCSTRPRAHSKAGSSGSGSIAWSREATCRSEPSRSST